MVGSSPAVLLGFVGREVLALVIVTNVPFLLRFSKYTQLYCRVNGIWISIDAEQTTVVQWYLISEEGSLSRFVRTCFRLCDIRAWRFRETRGNVKREPISGKRIAIPVAVTF